MAIKAIALDIDGTLVTSERVVSPRTKQALIDAQRAGNTVILASGRPAQGLRELAHELELDRHHGMIVAFNGAQVRDAMTDEVLFDQGMSAEDARAVLHHIKNFDVIPMIVVDDRLYIEDAYRCDITFMGERMNIIKHERDGCVLRLHEVRDLEAWCTEPQSKILTAGTPSYLEEHWREMSAPFEGRLSCMFTAPFYYEFTALGIDKARALRHVFEHRGIDPAGLVAFGDGQNDLSMVRFAGVGVAMGNAVDELKAAADMVTATNNEDGIALALEKLLG